MWLLFPNVAEILSPTYNKNDTYPYSLEARCDKDDTTSYGGIEGAIRCLKENRGEVVFIDHNKVQSMLLRTQVLHILKSSQMLPIFFIWETLKKNTNLIKLYVNPSMPDTGVGNKLPWSILKFDQMHQPFCDFPPPQKKI